MSTEPTIRNADVSKPTVCPCYGCGDDVPDDDAHRVYRYGETVMCDKCRAETLVEVTAQARDILGDIEYVAASLRALVESRADKHDHKTLADWWGKGSYGRGLMVGGEIDLEFLFREMATKATAGVTP